MAARPSIRAATAVSWTLPSWMPTSASRRASNATSCTIFTGPTRAEQLRRARRSRHGERVDHGDVPAVVPRELHRADARAVGEHAAGLEVDGDARARGRGRRGDLAQLVIAGDDARAPAETSRRMTRVAAITSRRRPRRGDGAAGGDAPGRSPMRGRRRVRRRLQARARRTRRSPSSGCGAHCSEKPWRGVGSQASSHEPRRSARPTGPPTRSPFGQIDRADAAHVVVRQGPHRGRRPACRCANIVACSSPEWAMPRKWPVSCVMMLWKS